MKEFVVLIVCLNLVYELVDFVFPVSKMKGSIKSFVLTFMLYVIVDWIVALF